MLAIQTCYCVAKCLSTLTCLLFWVTGCCWARAVFQFTCFITARQQEVTITSTSQQVRRRRKKGEIVSLRIGYKIFSFKQYLRERLHVIKSESATQTSSPSVHQHTFEDLFSLFLSLSYVLSRFSHVSHPWWSPFGHTLLHGHTSSYIILSLPTRVIHVYIKTSFISLILSCCHGRRYFCHCDSIKRASHRPPSRPTTSPTSGALCSSHTHF